MPIMNKKRVDNRVEEKSREAPAAVRRQGAEGGDVEGWGGGWRPVGRGGEGGGGRGVETALDGCY